MSPAESPPPPSQGGVPQHPQLPVPNPPRAWAEALRWVFSFPAVLILLVMATAFAQARQGLSDPDIWWHLRNAEYLLTSHKFIYADMYSFTVAGHSWVNTEWMSEVPYFLAWRAFGLLGIKFLSIALIEAIFLGLLYLCWKESGRLVSGGPPWCCDLRPPHSSFRLSLSCHSHYFVAALPIPWEWSPLGDPPAVLAMD